MLRTSNRSQSQISAQVIAETLVTITGHLPEIPACNPEYQ